jgi:ribosome biogenesis GTPase
MTRDEQLVEGRVLRLTGNNYEVQVGDELIRCRIAGKLKKEKKSAMKACAVGDRVEILVSDEQEGRIENVLERTNKLSRADVREGKKEQVIVANVDSVMMVQACADPAMDPHLIDRSIVMALAGDIPPILVLNKTDLVDAELVNDVKGLYEKLGYRVHATSAMTGEGVESLRDELVGSTTVLFGPSGVGKSSLLNCVEDGLGLKVREISEGDRTGKHTTTWVELIPLEGGGYACDTPGIEYFTLWAVDPDDLGLYFIEFEPYLGRCKFTNCRHNSEPKCAVKAALNAGDIDERRYQSYLKILDSLENPRHGGTVH